MSFVVADYKWPERPHLLYSDRLHASQWERQTDAHAVLGQYPMPRDPGSATAASPCYALSLPSNEPDRRTPFLKKRKLTVFINRRDRNVPEGRIYFTAIPHPNRRKDDVYFIRGSIASNLGDKILRVFLKARTELRAEVMQQIPTTLHSLVEGYIPSIDESDRLDDVASVIRYSIYETVRRQSKEAKPGKKQHQNQTECEFLETVMNRPYLAAGTKSCLHEDLRRLRHEVFGGFYTIEEVRCANKLNIACGSTISISGPYQKELKPDSFSLPFAKPEALDAFFDTLRDHHAQLAMRGITIDDILAGETESLSVPRLPEPSLPIPAAPLLPAAVGVTHQLNQTEDVNANKPLLGSVVPPQALSVHQETQTEAADEVLLPVRQEPPSCWSQFASALLSFLSTVWNWLICKPT